ncbi:MAG TPA: CvpA family protein [Thermopetrobacter sp.]|nr:CvpA family protein [Thermopetrobacter sp.]
MDGCRGVSRNLRARRRSRAGCARCGKKRFQCPRGGAIFRDVDPAARRCRIRATTDGGRMPFTYFDIGVIVITLFSALFAVMRGFTREVFSLLAWVAAAAAAWWSIGMDDLVAIARGYVADDKLALAVTAGVVFLVTLVVLSLLFARLSDMVSESVIGTLDRTLGLVFGVARGILLVTVIYIFYIWWAPARGDESWLRGARTLPLINATAEMVIGFLPQDIAGVISDNMARRASAAEGAGNGGAGTGAGQPDYGRGDRSRLENLIESQQN